MSTVIINKEPIPTHHLVIARIAELEAQRDRYLKALKEVDDYLDNAPTLRAIVRRALDGDA